MSKNEIVYLESAIKFFKKELFQHFTSIQYNLGR